MLPGQPAVDLLKHQLRLSSVRLSEGQLRSQRGYLGVQLVSQQQDREAPRYELLLTATVLPSNAGARSAC